MSCSVCQDVTCEVSLCSVLSYCTEYGVLCRCWNICCESECLASVYTGCIATGNLHMLSSQSWMLSVWSMFLLQSASSPWFGDYCSWYGWNQAVCVCLWRRPVQRRPGMVLDYVHKWQTVMLYFVWTTILAPPLIYNPWPWSGQLQLCRHQKCASLVLPVFCWLACFTLHHCLICKLQPFWYLSDSGVA